MNDPYLLEFNAALTARWEREARERRAAAIRKVTLPIAGLTGAGVLTLGVLLIAILLTPMFAGVTGASSATLALRVTVALLMAGTMYLSFIASWFSTGRYERLRTAFAGLVLAFAAGTMFSIDMPTNPARATIVLTMLAGAVVGPLAALLVPRKKHLY